MFQICFYVHLQSDLAFVDYLSSDDEIKKKVGTSLV